MASADDVLKQFEGRYSVLAMTIHYTHDHVIRFEDDDTARGLVSSHSELVRNGEPAPADWPEGAETFRRYVESH